MGVFTSPVHYSDDVFPRPHSFSRFWVWLDTALVKRRTHALFRQPSFRYLQGLRNAADSNWQDIIVMNGIFEKQRYAPENNFSGKQGNTKGPHHPETHQETCSSFSKYFLPIGWLLKKKMFMALETVFGLFWLQMLHKAIKGLLLFSERNAACSDKRTT